MGSFLFLFLWLVVWLFAMFVLEVLAAEVQHIEALNGTLSAMVDFALAQYNLLNLKGQLEIENIAL